jgi:hypothetical protein
VRNRPDAAAILERFDSRGLGSRTAGLGAYAAVQVWAQAVERAGSLDLAAVAEALRRGRFDTVLGRVAFDYKGDLEHAAWQWKVWTDGDYVPLQHLSATQGLSTSLSSHRADPRPSRRPELSSMPRPARYSPARRSLVSAHVIRRAGERKRREHPRSA